MTEQKEVNLEYKLGQVQLILGRDGGGKTIFALREAFCTLKENKLDRLLWANGEVNPRAGKTWLPHLEMAKNGKVTPWHQMNPEKAEDILRNLDAKVGLIDAHSLGLPIDSNTDDKERYCGFVDKLKGLDAEGTVFVLDVNFNDSESREYAGAKLKRLGTALKKVAEELNIFFIVTAIVPRPKDKQPLYRKAEEHYALKGDVKKDRFDHIQVAEWCRQSGGTSIQHIIT
ncbi:hypothetical protein [Vibrio crassostreae]|uniref:hypothetical protein n=1 Tax=Vibrio crassostreae TaxID=246167 RepID=UPI001B313B73|nr:hypothetical protein [Vibrio crassostreae]